ncbi:MAG: aldehyde ferredoxin oxidoreductase N-terminal domain-containing protein [Candidatus Wallbacteria bacterium]|nr:aldehyde ferredoxin oxidoreductase N-terminal domain-containing protein [Candidatus Wallbacteria bacterium]
MTARQKFLEIDLPNRDLKIKKIEDQVLEKYPAGSALATKILFDYFVQEPLRCASPEGCYLVFTLGLFADLNFSGLNSIFVTFPEPHAGNFEESTLCGKFAGAFRSTGWAGFSLSGKSDVPVIVVFEKNQAYLEELPENSGVRDLSSFFRKYRDEGHEVLTVVETVTNSPGITLLASDSGDARMLTGGPGLAALLYLKNVLALVVRRDPLEESFRPQDSARISDKTNLWLVRESLKNWSDELYISNPADLLAEFEALFSTAEPIGSACPGCEVECRQRVRFPDLEISCIRPGPIDLLNLLVLKKKVPDCIHLWKSLNDAGIDLELFASIYNFLEQARREGYELFERDHLTVDELFTNLLEKKGEFRALSEGLYLGAERYHVFGAEAANLVRNFELPVSVDVRVSTMLSLLALTGVSRPRIPQIFWHYYFNRQQPACFWDDSKALYSVRSAIEFQDYQGVLGILGFCPQACILNWTRQELDQIFKGLGSGMSFSSLLLASRRAYILKRIFNLKRASFPYERISWRMLVKPKIFDDRNYFSDFQRTIFLYYSERGMNEFGFPGSEIIKELGLEAEAWI